MKCLNLHIIPILVLMVPLSMIGQGVSQSRHNLSASGKGQIKSLASDGICIHCHTSHIENPKNPMWNRKQSGAIYTLYDSSTLDAKPGQPDGTSILCLSCHDGTIALGATLKNPNNKSFNHRMSKRGDLGTDLSDDHPISFVYDNELSIEDGQLENPHSLPKNSLDRESKLQCTSCHDSHKDIEGNFLKHSNEFSDLCLTCHNIDYWNSSSHNLSNSTWNGSAPNPWAHMDNPYNTVSKNGCSNCHDTHGANGKERLLKFEGEEKNCLDCHNGNVAKINIQKEFTKPYRHNVTSYTNTHDPLENPFTQPKHIECVDCHNSHASSKKDAQAPFIKGANLGVSGIDRNGGHVQQAEYEYEICFKCHADNPVDLPNTKRYLGSINNRLDFSPNNVSVHPVIEEGNNLSPRGLIEPFNSGSKIYCSSCHTSDGSNASSGPHGSFYPRILKSQYNLDKTPLMGNNWPVQMTNDFALCFECHEANAVANIHTNISKGHFMETIGCNACHDPHGYEGGNLNENGFGINFDQAVIQPNPLNGRMIDLDAKKCFMTCHDPRGVVNYTHKAEGSDY